MDDAKKQLADKIKTANNILVTVSRNPSVDQLASCLGLTLLLNKQGKHTAAVFSGKIPSTIEFLKPEDTLEKNTDSLRDFIIALDKAKADKLRYKVEDNVVRIFITPYRTSISEADLDFSQGDFNVDVVVALGVGEQEDLDEAITAHGRILHDATVASINTANSGGLGTINWSDPQASSLSELVAELAQTLGGNLLDEQTATALLTGIVSETDRFSNDKTSSQTMSISAALMAAGANQQLVASKLEEPEQPVISIQSDESDDADKNTSDDEKKPKADDGTIEIDHNESATGHKAEVPPPLELPSPEANDDSVSDNPDDSESEKESDEPSPVMSARPKLVTEPPSLGGTLTANSTQERLDPANDPLGASKTDPPHLLDRKADPLTKLEPPQDAEVPAPEPLSPEPLIPETPEPEISQSPAEPSIPDFTPPPSPWVPPSPDLPPAPVVSVDSPQASSSYSTLAELEEEAKNLSKDPSTLDTARDEVNRALSTDAATAQVSPEPIQALNAQPLGTTLHPDELPTETPLVSGISTDPTEPTEIIPPAPLISNELPVEPAPQVIDANAPPPVPPPIPFQFGTPPQA